MATCPSLRVVMCRLNEGHDARQKRFGRLLLKIRAGNLSPPTPTHSLLQSSFFIGISGFAGEGKQTHSIRMLSSALLYMSIAVKL